MPSGIVVSNEAGGELRLAASLEDYFDGPVSSSKWSWGTWNGGTFIPAPSGGILEVQSPSGSAALGSKSSHTQRVLEGRVSFGAGPWEHVGFADASFSYRWAILSTAGTGAGVYARTHDGSQETTTLLSGVTLDEYHDFRIVWGASSVEYFVDGVSMAVHPKAVSGPLYAFLSNNSAEGTLRIDWVRVESYQAGSQTFVSRATWGRRPPGAP
jgi:hypothetical protein